MYFLVVGEKVEVFCVLDEFEVMGFWERMIVEYLDWVFGVEDLCVIERFLVFV